MKIIIQKYGGTSVSTKEGREQIASHVHSAIEEGYSPLVVVSAMGRLGDPYATDTLISLVEDPSYHPTLRELDLIMSCGETISSVVVAGTLRSKDIDAVALTGSQAGIFTDAVFSSANITEVDPENLLSLISKGKVPVVAGFQGATSQGDVTTLGRGGSDTTATVLGVYLKADTVEIYTDVDGIKTADPKLVPDARTMGTITYEEVSQMAYEGAKILSPKAVDIAMKNDLQLRVRSTFDDSKGTLVTRDAGKMIWKDMAEVRPVTSVTHRPELSQISVPLEADVSPWNVFQTLADKGLSIDMILVTPQGCSFVLRDDMAPLAEKSLRALNLEPKVIRGCAKVTVVGLGMRGVPGVMARVSLALRESQVEILQTADSHVTISCLVHGEDLEKAVQCLHAKFDLANQVSQKEDYL